jgi:GntP family gluconate:H+ symporter
VPFVLIQVIMVGLIIAFPGIVSSGLDKEEVYDMEKIRIQMERDMLKQDSLGTKPEPGVLPDPAAIPEPEPQTDKDIDELFKQQPEVKK